MHVLLSLKNMRHFFINYNYIPVPPIPLRFVSLLVRRAIAACIGIVLACPKSTDNPKSVSSRFAVSLPRENELPDVGRLHPFRPISTEVDTYKHYTIFFEKHSEKITNF